MSDTSYSPPAVGLGAPLGNFRSTGDPMRFAIPSVLLVIAILAAVYGMRTLGATGEGGCFGAWLLWLALIFGAGSLPTLVALLREGSWQVLAYADGMVIRQGSTEVARRWDEIRSLEWSSLFSFTFGEGDGIPVYNARRCTIETEQIETYEFSGRAAEQLGALIQDKIHSRLLARAMDTLRSGGELEFGKLALSREGIGKRGELIPWDKVEEVRSSAGQVSIRAVRGYGRRKMEVACSTANYFLLPEVLQGAAGGKLRI